MYWATELDLAGFGNYVFKRRRIIGSEDVGPADSMVAVQVRALYENWLEARKGKPKEQQFAVGERLFLVHAVIILARVRSRGPSTTAWLRTTGCSPGETIPDPYVAEGRAARTRKRD